MEHDTRLNMCTREVKRIFILKLDVKKGNFLFLTSKNYLLASKHCTISRVWFFFSPLPISFSPQERRVQGWGINKWMKEPRAWHRWEKQTKNRKTGVLITDPARPVCTGRAPERTLRALQRGSPKSADPAGAEMGRRAPKGGSEPGVLWSSGACVIARDQ
jgi:hypothetical protein